MVKNMRFWLNPNRFKPCIYYVIKENRLTIYSSTGTRIYYPTAKSYKRLEQLLSRSWMNQYNAVESNSSYRKLWLRDGMPW